VRVDLLELVRESMKAPGRDPDAAPTTPATLGLPEERVEIYVNPRVAMGLLTIAVCLVAPGAASRPHIELCSRPPRVSIRPGPGEGERVLVPARTLIAPAEHCIEAAARLCGVGVERRGGAIELSWPTSRDEREPKPA